MKTLTMTALIAMILSFLRDEKSFSVVRDFAYEYYESETNCKLDSALHVLFPVLVPYLEYEEAFGDKDRRKKIQRLYQVLQLHNVRPEHAVFALNFDKIQQFHRKLENQLLTRYVYDEQLKKLSPADFNLEAVARWAKAHKTLDSMDESKMT